LLAAIWNTLPDVPDILFRDEEDFHLPILEAEGSWHGILVNSSFLGSAEPRRVSPGVRTFYSEQDAQDE
jgi:hypothetical protein